MRSSVRSAAFHKVGLCRLCRLCAGHVLIGLLLLDLFTFFITKSLMSRLTLQVKVAIEQHSGLLKREAAVRLKLWLAKLSEQVNIPVAPTAQAGHFEILGRCLTQLHTWHDCHSFTDLHTKAEQSSNLQFMKVWFIKVCRLLNKSTAHYANHAPQLCSTCCDACQ